MGKCCVSFENLRESTANSSKFPGKFKTSSSEVTNHLFWKWSLSKIFFKKFEIFKNKVFTLGIKKFCPIYTAFTNIVSSYLEKHFKSLYEAIWMLRKSATLRTFICPFAIIRQNGESQNGCFKKTKHAKFSEKRTFLPPGTHTYEHFLLRDTRTYVCVSGGKKRSFFGKFGVLCFLETPVLRFALFPYYRRYYSAVYE